MAYLDRPRADGDFRADPPEAAFGLADDPLVAFLAAEADLALVAVADRPLPVALDDEDRLAADRVAAFLAVGFAAAFLVVPVEDPPGDPLPPVVLALLADELRLAVTALLELRDADVPLAFLVAVAFLVPLAFLVAVAFLVLPVPLAVRLPVFLPADVDLLPDFLAPPVDAVILPGAFLLPADFFAPLDAEVFLADADVFLAVPLLAEPLPVVDDPRAAMRVVVLSLPTAALTAELAAPATAPVAAPVTISPTTSFAFS